MAEFPTSFADETRSLVKGLDNHAAEASHVLGQNGYEVRYGLTEYYAGSIAIMALQRQIRKHEFADQTEERFGSRQSTQEWLGRDGGKAVFLLLQDQHYIGQRLAGYAWVSPVASPDLPGSEHEFAMRLGEPGIHRSLAIPFASVVLGASQRLFEARNFWLQTWESNREAVRAYKAVGFQVAKASLEVHDEPVRIKIRSDMRLLMERA